MYRSTTPTLVLRVKNDDFDMGKIETCHVTLKSESNGHELLITNPDIDEDEQTISVTLTQEQTLEFELGSIKIQVKLMLDNGTVIASHVVRTSMREILEEEILSSTEELITEPETPEENTEEGEPDGT